MNDHSPAFDRYIGIDYSGAQTPDQHDAYTVAAWLRETDLSGKLQTYFHPQLQFQESAIEKDVEGWILGVM